MALSKNSHNILASSRSTLCVLTILSHRILKRHVSENQDFYKINHFYCLIKEILKTVFLDFLFYIGIQSINNVVIVSGAQQNNSAIHIHVSILPQTPLQSRLLLNIEQSSLCYTVSRALLVIHFKYSSVYMSNPNSLTIPSLHPFPLVTVSSFSKSVSLFLFCKYVHLHHFFLYFAYKQYHMIFLSLTYFTRYDNFQILPSCCKWHYFIFF